MPRSALTVLLLVLTLLAFAGYFFWLDEPVVSGWLDILGMLLTIATTASIVRDGGAFDSRAFHRTRPDGDRGAFRISTMGLLIPAFGVGLMAVAYALICNLGWANALGLATASSLPVLFCSVAFASGLTLILSSESRRVFTSILLLLPPFLATLWMMEVGFRWLAHLYYLRGLPPGYGGSFLYNHAWGPLVGAVGYSLTWWLVARRRRWTAAIALAAFTGACVPLASFLGPRSYPQTPPLPEASLQITRTAPVADPLEERLREIFREGHRQTPQDSCDVPIFLGGRLHVRGLREDEFIFSDRGITGERETYGNPMAVEVVRGETWRNGEVGTYSPGIAPFILRAELPPGMTGEHAVFAALAKRLPAPTTLLPEQDGLRSDWTYLDWINVDEKQTSIAAVERSPWQIGGAVFRMEDSASFDLAKGGFHRFSSGGALKVLPYREDRDPGSISIRIIDPRIGDPQLDGISINIFPRLPAVLLRDPLTGETVALRVQQDGESGFSAWIRYKIRVLNDYQRMDPAEREKRLRSRLYLFKAWPVARVAVAVPPPP